MSLLEEQIAERPDYALLFGSLGLAYAGLDRKEEAIEAGLRGAELLPIERDSIVGSWQLADLGFTYLRVGEYEAAIDTFEVYLSHPGWFSIGALQLDPRMEPLLDHPRFLDLIARFSPDSTGRQP